MDTKNAPEKLALISAADALGGQAALATALGYGDRRCVWPWFATARRFPVELCPALERATGLVGRPVHCERLRPDVRWVRIPDAGWPWHIDGLPLIDHATGLLPGTAQLRAAA